MSRKKKKFLWGVFIFGALEIIIGSLTLIAVTISLLSGISTKPYNVLVFILFSSFISFVLGWGIWAYNSKSRSLLLYFATLVILSKILIFFKIITLNGALETRIPSSVKDAISLVYHLCIIWYFNYKSVKSHFISSS